MLHVIKYFVKSLKIIQNESGMCKSELTISQLANCAVNRAFVQRARPMAATIVKYSRYHTIVALDLILKTPHGSYDREVQ